MVEQHDADSAAVVLIDHAGAWSKRWRRSLGTDKDDAPIGIDTSRATLMVGICVTAESE